MLASKVWGSWQQHGAVLHVTQACALRWCRARLWLPRTGHDRWLHSGSLQAARTAMLGYEKVSGTTTLSAPEGNVQALGAWATFADQPPGATCTHSPVEELGVPLHSLETTCDVLQHPATSNSTMLSAVSLAECAALKYDRGLPCQSGWLHPWALACTPDSKMHRHRGDDSTPHAGDFGFFTQLAGCCECGAAPRGADQRSVALANTADTWCWRRLPPRFPAGDAPGRPPTTGG